MPLLRHPHKVVPPCRRASASSSFYGCLFYLIVLTICLPIFNDNNPGVRAAVVVGSPAATKLSTSNVKTDTAQSKGEFHSFKTISKLFLIPFNVAYKNSLSASQDILLGI